MTRSSALDPMSQRTARPNPTHIGRLGDEVPGDMIWNRDNWHSPHGSAKICFEENFKELRYYSQLGLKTFWWGAIDNVEKHNRYLHSIGTMYVAGRWHEKLFESDHSIDIETEREYLRIATLLHDYGHLPFSHLFEEIFDELHWIPFPHSKRPWHEVLTPRKFEILLEKSLVDQLTIKSYLTERLGYEPNDVLRLIEGWCGKAYLDAIVNSAFDADKIDYILRDISFLNGFGSLHSEIPGSVAALSASDWLDQFLGPQNRSPEGLIRLNERSALMALDLLETRRDLYLKFYLAPELRAMERITAFVLICYLGLFLPEKLLESVQNSTEPFDFDHGETKVRIASEMIIDKYASIIRENRNDQLMLREGLLLERLLEELCDQDYRIDEPAIEVLSALRKIINTFPNKKDSNGVNLGKTVREVYDKLHVAGPYYADARHEQQLRETVRELTLLHQSAVLFDVVKTPRFLATPSSRNFGLRGGTATSVFGETFLVPDGRPSQWTVKSRAKVPLHSVDFGHLNHRYLQILLLDPLNKPAKAAYIDQQFRRKCARSNIELAESPIFKYGASNGSH